MEDSQTTIEMESRPDDNAQNSKPVALRQSTTLLHHVHIQQMEDNQTTNQLQTEPREADKELTNLPDDDAENPVGEIRYPTIQIIQTFTEGEVLQVDSVG